jgi:hypothetical protein
MIRDDTNPNMPTMTAPHDVGEGHLGGVVAQVPALCRRELLAAVQRFARTR